MVKLDEELQKELPKGIIRWYDFEKGSKALYISADTPLDISLSEALSECGMAVDCVHADKLAAWGKKDYPYVIIASAAEQAKGKAEAAELIKKAGSLLKKSGKLFLATDNRMSIRYFCGDKDPYTGRNFDGIEDYKRVGTIDREILAGRLYSKAELASMLENAGFMNYKFYSVFPEIACPQILLADGYMPNEELNIRLFPQYHSPDTVFLEEENLYSGLMANGMFHTMANGFFIECTVDGALSTAEQITVSMERGRKNALCTVVLQEGKVVKRPLYEEGLIKLESLKANQDDLMAHGIKMVEAEITDGRLVMPYQDGIPLAKYFRDSIRKEQEEFLRQFDNLWQLILHSSEHVPYEEVDWEHFNPNWDEECDLKKQKKIDRSQWRKVAFGTETDKENLGVILRRGYIDLVLLNGFRADGEYIFFDQEIYIDCLPAKAIMLRNIDLLYHAEPEIESLFPRKNLLERYRIEPCKEIYYAFIGHFLKKLRNDDILLKYHEIRRRKHEVLHSNRQRMNYSTEEYLRLFVEIFKNTDNKKLYLFGSGNFTKKFLALYKEDYAVEGILDNNEKKWGMQMEGIAITAPSILKELDASTYKVIICIKNYTGVLKQVKELGATNIGVYDTNMEYPRKQKAVLMESASKQQEKKKYHVGYVAGVFDLFHIGHLNLLRRAKEQCDYLIVGVVTDEGVRKNKKTDSFIPFEERLALVAACRYVDEAVGIPLEFCETKDAYLKFQFDAQFSGSDYSKDPAWLKKREFLRERGAELVFFPYTESTSSTQLKAMIDRKLM